MLLLEANKESENKTESQNKAVLSFLKSQPRGSGAGRKREPALPDTLRAGLKEEESIKPPGIPGGWVPRITFTV